MVIQIILWNILIHLQIWLNQVSLITSQLIKLNNHIPLFVDQVHLGIFPKNAFKINPSFDLNFNVNPQKNLIEQKHGLVNTQKVDFLSESLTLFLQFPFLPFHNFLILILIQAQIRAWIAQFFSERNVTICGERFRNFLGLLEVLLKQSLLPV